MDETPTVEYRVRKLVAEHLDKTIADVTPESTIESLGADSLDQIEILMALEIEFDIEIPDEDAPVDGSSVADLIAAVEKARG